MENRRKLDTVKFPNKIGSSDVEHNSHALFLTWREMFSLNISFIFQYDKEIDFRTHVFCHSLRIIYFFICTTLCCQNQFEHAKEPHTTIKRKGLETIKDALKLQRFVIYTDSFSDLDCNKEDTYIYVNLTDGRSSKHKVSKDKITSNFSSERVDIRDDLNIYINPAILDNSNGFLI